MKTNLININIIGLLLSLLAIGSTVNAQNTSLLIGTWSLDFEATLTIAKQSRGSLFESLEPSQMNEIQSTHEGRQISFAEDGGYVFLLPNGIGLNGQWELSSDLSTLITIDQEGNRTEHSIDTLDSQKLVITNQNGQQSAMFHQWAFNRIGE